MNERKLFIDALRLPKSDERSAYLDGACGGDGEVRRQVEALLREHEVLGSFLETPALPLPETIVEPTLDERPGTVIGHYKLLEQLGEGGFGIVFLAEQRQPLRRQVAVKVLKPGMDSRQVIARFEAERQALALMDHPHIARVLDGGETGTGRPYFVMDLVRGPPITEFCDRNQLALKDRLELFITVCQAVQHAHHKGIIHRDLKPSNVLVAKHDDRPVAKVIDFGIAKALGRHASDPLPFTSHTLMLGTPIYMSPEQAGLRGQDMDTRSDVYSLGVLLYELLTGTTPLDKDRLKNLGYDELRRTIREEEPPKPSTRVNSLASAAPATSTPAGPTRTLGDRKRLSRLFQGDLDWIVMRALEKDRNRRFETADAFAEDLRRYLADQPVLSGPPGAGYRLRKFVRRNKGPVLAASAVILALVGGFVGTGIGFVRAEAARREEARQRGIADEKGIRATTAEKLAHQRLAEVVQQERRTAEEAAIAQAVSDFLQRDLLGQADIGKQAFLGGTAERIPNITVVELLDRAAKAVGWKFVNQPLTEAAVRLTLGDTYQALGRFSEAQPHLERSVELRTDKLGAHHPDTLISRNNLATLYVAQGKYDQAEPLFREVLEAHIAQLGADHYDTLINKNTTASSCALCSIPANR